ncbi:SWI/SNF complex subunit SWI3B [Aristolochia californica]|uniref:SWI/SNF complex subunit SWI3B n=1 Tax=Aristolochia californica TaxID=171875 RepID=UPI0035E2CA9E
MASTPPPPIAGPAAPPPVIPPNPPEPQPVIALPSVNTESPATESNQLATPRQQESFSSAPSTVTIPSYSRWFSWKKIHETERRILSEFFDSKSPSRNPKTYKYYRNLIIKKYRENPSRKITFTEVRKTIVGDVGSIRRVFDFLENWGLINYTSSRQSLKWEDKESKSAAISSSPSSAGSQNTNAKKEGGRKACDGCKSAISIACFSCVKVDLTLCARCFVRGNYRVGLNSADFKRVDISEEPTKTDWTDKETLRLLEGLLHYGDDWKKVAHHVNSRSEKECAVHFLKLPFGEQFMEPVDADEIGKNCNDLPNHQSNSETVSEDTALSSPSKSRHLTPLADASNPIMAQAAFLSAFVGSDIAEATAQAAVRALSEQDFTSSQGEYGVQASEFIEEIDKEGPSAINVHTAARSLEEAAMEASSLLEKEENAVEQSISDIIEVQMKEVQDKLVNFERLEMHMEKEWAQLQQLKELLFADQLTLLHQRGPKKFSQSAEEKIKVSDVVT